ncbi:MAG: hypothetical protein K5765_08770 [Clostridia bacterium]|nr:hypothetical protein [Clostridia bacterium]
MRQGKVIIINIIIVLLAAASIVTLYLGSFMDIKANLNVNNENVQEIVAMFGENKSGEGSGEGEGSGSTIDVSALGEFNINIPFTISIKNTDAINCIFKFNNRKEVVTQFVDREITVIVENLLTSAKEIFKVATNALVNKAVDEAKKAIEQQISSTGGENQTAVSEVLEEYGVNDQTIENVKTELSDAVTTVLNGGDSDDIKNIIENSTTIDSILKAFQEAKMKNELGVSELSESQKEEANSKAMQSKDELLVKYDEVVEKYGDENGKITSATIVNTVLEQTGINKSEEGGETTKITTEEELVEFLSNKVNTAIDNSKEYIGYVLIGLGAFVLLVMASWGYVALKIIIKLFAKNKTVRFGLAQAFGWMPHVFFIGLPMLVVKLSGFIMEKFGTQLPEQAQKVVNMMKEILSLNLHSLTWVSAACTIPLLVFSFFYYKWRRQIKSDINYKKNK